MGFEEYNGKWYLPSQRRWEDTPPAPIAHRATASTSTNQSSRDLIIVMLEEFRGCRAYLGGRINGRKARMGRVESDVSVVSNHLSFDTLISLIQ